jgi:hypothetical protein
LGKKPGNGAVTHAAADTLRDWPNTAMAPEAARNVRLLTVLISQPRYLVFTAVKKTLSRERAKVKEQFYNHGAFYL